MSWVFIILSLCLRKCWPCQAQQNNIKILFLMQSTNTLTANNVVYQIGLFFHHSCEWVFMLVPSWVSGLFWSWKLNIGFFCWITHQTSLQPADAIQWSVRCHSVWSLPDVPGHAAPHLKELLLNFFGTYSKVTSETFNKSISQCLKSLFLYHLLSKSNAI